jgi:hypothetical protein
MEKSDLGIFTIQRLLRRHEMPQSLRRKGFTRKTTAGDNAEEAGSVAFVSHRSEEAVVAATLKSALIRDFLGLLDIFVSSDTTSISAGEE